MAEAQGTGGTSTAMVAIVAIVLLVLMGFLFFRGGFRRHDSGNPSLKGNVEISVPKPGAAK